MPRRLGWRVATSPRSVAVALSAGLGLIVASGAISTTLADPPVLLIQQSEKQSGCWRDGAWHAEGTRIPVPLQSRLAVPGYSLCKDGRWTFVVARRQ